MKNWGKMMEFHYKNPITVFGNKKTKHRIFVCPLCPARKEGQKALRFHLTYIHQKRNLPSKIKNNNNIKLGIFKNIQEFYRFTNHAHGVKSSRFMRI